MKKFFGIITAFVAVILVASNVNIAEAASIPTAKPVDVDLVTKAKADYHNDSIKVNKKFEKTIAKAQTIFDKNKSVAKQVYDKNISKANNDPVLIHKAELQYKSMMAKAKMEYNNAYKNAKMMHYDEIQNIKKLYSQPIGFWNKVV